MVGKGKLDKDVAMGANFFCERLALILTFSPWEKEQMSLDSGCADARSASPAAGFSKWQPTILPLPRSGRGTG
jgi:hypothetical protein